MVSVFGLQVPLFEILIVFVVLLTAGLIFVLLELKKLNSYLMVERSDLQRLERDLGTLEQEEKRISQPRPSAPAQPQQPTYQQPQFK